MTDITTVIELAVIITVGLTSLLINFYLIMNNPLLKMKAMRWISPKSSYGLWITVLPGRQLVFDAVKFANKEKAFTRNEQIFPVAEDDRIYSYGRAPVQINSTKDAKALSLEAPKPAESTRDPGKLHAFTQLYTAQADARARRKNKLDPKIVMYILYLLAIFFVISLYYFYNDHNLLNTLVNGAAAPSKDSLGNLIPAIH